MASRPRPGKFLDRYMRQEDAGRPSHTLPTKKEHEAASKSDEADGGEVVTVSLSAEAYAAIADRAPDPSEADNLGGYRISLPRALLGRLLRLRGPNDRSFSDVILRLALMG